MICLITIPRENRDGDMEDVGNLTGIEAGDGGDQTSELGMAKERRHKMKFIGVIFRLFSATPEELHSDPHHLYGDHKQQPGHP